MGRQVLAQQPPREGRGDQDGTFEIVFVPGVTLEPAFDKGTPISMLHPGLDDYEEPTAFVGYRSDGVEIKVPIENVKATQAKKLVPELQAQRPKTSDPK